MQAWWISFSRRAPGCVVADDAEEARCIAHEETGVFPEDVQPLPALATPVLTMQRPWHAERNDPACASPAACAGHTTCQALSLKCPVARL